MDFQTYKVKEWSPQTRKQLTPNIEPGRHDA
jgi:hypothetical protein